MKKIRKLKIFLMQEIFEEKFDIGSNRLAGIEIESSIMFLNPIILQELLKIFMFVILISRDLNWCIGFDNSTKSE